MVVHLLWPEMPPTTGFLLLLIQVLCLSLKAYGCCFIPFQQLYPLRGEPQTRPHPCPCVRSLAGQHCFSLRVFHTALLVGLGRPGLGKWHLLRGGYWAYFWVKKVPALVLTTEEEGSVSSGDALGQKSFSCWVWGWTPLLTVPAGECYPLTASPAMSLGQLWGKTSGVDLGRTWHFLTTHSITICSEKVPLWG